MSKTLILVALLISGNVFAQNKFMAIMGGGAEPQDKETTIFDADVTELGSFLNRTTTWRPTITFNGGHTTTEGLIANGIGRRGVANTQFTKAEYERTIEDYKRKINSGEIKSGDQLLVWISTHGAIQRDGETSHSISTSGAAAANLTTLDGAPLVNMDQMQSLINLASSKGIKLGIMDFSCHSGASMALSNPNTCIISSSGPKHFGYSNWGGLFGGNLKAGKSLEDVFLETLNERSDPAFPMISSPVGKEIQDQIYPMATPFFYTWNANPHHNKLTSFLEGQVIKNQCEEADRSFQQLISFSQEVEAIVKPAGKKGPNYNEFRNAVAEYHNLLDQMRTDLTGMNITDLESRTEKACAPFQSYFTDGKPSHVVEQCRSKPWTHKEMIAMNWDAEIARLSNQLAGSTDVQKKSWLETQKKWFENGKVKTAELLAANPNYATYMNYYKNLPDLQRRTWELANNVSKATQKLYTDLYRAKSRTDARPNPCKNFVL